MTSTTMDKSEPCETEFRRQELYISVEKMLAAMPRDPLADKLPIVELRPFSKKVWRRANSLPNQFARQPMPYRVNAGTYTNNLDPEQDLRRGTASPRKEQFPRSSSVQSDRSPRANPRHPAAKDKEYFVQHPLGFATPGDREKTTFDDIQNGASPNVHYSCLNRAMTDGDFIKQQGMRVKGQKLKDLPPKLSILYADPATYYRISRSFTMPVNFKSQSIVDNLYYRIAHLQTEYANEYEADRSKLLPNLHIGRPTMKANRVGDSKENSQQDEYESIPPIGVKNSLEILSQYGRPLGIERQLTTELSNTLSQFRRTKVKLNNPAASFKAFPTLQREPTIGELLLKHGNEQNSSRKNGSSSIKTLSYRGGSRSSNVKSEMGDSGLQTPDNAVEVPPTGKLSRINSQKSKESNSLSSNASLAGSIVVERLNKSSPESPAVLK